MQKSRFTGWRFCYGIGLAIMHEEDVPVTVAEETQDGEQFETEAVFSGLAIIILCFQILIGTVSVPPPPDSGYMSELPGT